MCNRLMFVMLAITTAFLFATSPHAGPERTVAITFDDMPYVSGLASDTNASRALRANQRILSVLKRYGVPAVGFVNEKQVENLGAVGRQILEQWIGQDLDIANHTYSHADFNRLTVEQFEQEVIKGEKTFLPLTRQAGRERNFFRFPFNHTGDTKEKHDAMAAFLFDRGYELATCTIDTSDYLFNRAYALAVANRDGTRGARLREAYLRYSATEIDYYAGLDKQVIGDEPPEVMLLHDNLLNSEVLDEILGLLEARGYRFVRLHEAQSNAAYKIPDTYITSYGPMWGYRWAAERGVKVNGRLEPEVPEWVTLYSGVK
jgi:peptidoglycan/xylan/chitin deacetylase (PgdA/CDA1 family)